jgi:hypothetical protein
VCEEVAFAGLLCAGGPANAAGLRTPGRCRTNSGVVHVLLHDCEREIERNWANDVFGKANYTTVEGYRRKNGLTRLRHYVYGTAGDPRTVQQLRAALQATLL